MNSKPGKRTLMLVAAAAVALVFAATAWAGGTRETAKPTLNILCKEEAISTAADAK